MSFNCLHIMRPLLPFIPDVTSLNRQVTFQEKFVWTTLAILIYMVASQVPLFGIINSGTADPFYWMRMMMASNRGTLMDLGISPVVTASMIMQFLGMLELVKVDYNVKEDKILHGAANRLISLIMTVGSAIVQVLTGFYGDPKALGWTYCILLMVQLIFSGVIIILLDELLQKGYGLGNGVNLFIASNVCESIMWRAFSPKVFFTGRGIEFEGSLIAFFHLLIVRKNKFAALYEAFFRQNLPNMFSLVSTVVLFAFVIYLQGLRVELKTESTQVRGQTGMYPVKLLYSSTMPIIVQSYVISHICTISRFLYKRFPTYFLVRALGVWSSEGSSKYQPIKGLCYYILPPESIFDFKLRPFYFLFYVLFTIISCSMLSRAWVEVSDNTPTQVASQMKKNKMTLKGVREVNCASVLSKYIPTAALLGGCFTSLVVLISNLFDTIGSGTNIFLATSIVHQYLELFAKESAKKQGMSYID
ncbi:Protein transport protein Sec61 subunit alpha [Nosema bombycis CQ1]|uniref:Protein transport protein Sec61 subunit alpha n=2 Tax=Nosema bombycis TaxID=27978 RepID=R0MBY1_NOSB1|nr:Sec61alpha [Nosema bombycis]EOB11550.1 Protein transport protein Sec61 subunit alpha [Nosema bombycis CQ1]|eukprot:EOB11550.1 Protein transport protein Sec61 subunit alpha [Nosema bombycis CQ1]